MSFSQTFNCRDLILYFHSVPSYNCHKTVRRNKVFIACAILVLGGRAPRLCSAPRIATSGRTRFFEHVQSICFVFLVNQIAKFDERSVHRGLLVSLRKFRKSGPARGHIFVADQKKRGLWGRKAHV